MLHSKDLQCQKEHEYQSACTVYFQSPIPGEEHEAMPVHHLQLEVNNFIGHCKKKFKDQASEISIVK